MTEKLSNLLNQSIEQSELDEFLHDCKSDPDLLNAWQRYHIVDATLCNEITNADLKFDIADKVIKKLQVEKTLNQNSNLIPFTRKFTSPFYFKSMASLAVAASLLMGIYFIVQQPIAEPGKQQWIAESIDFVSMPHWQTDDVAIEETLNTLLVEHSEFTSITAMNGLGSYSKFIAYRN